MNAPLKLLILEDTPANAELIVAHLRNAGLDPNVRTVESERDYLTALDDAPDLIIADHSLPGCDGLSALRLMRARGLDIPFILVPDTIGEDLAVQMRRMGATDYLLKDRMAWLASMAKHALEVGRARDEQRRAAAELNRLAAIVAGSSDAIVSRTLDGTITSWNAAAERMFGWSAKEAIGQPLNLIHVNDDDGARQRANTEALLRGETVPLFETGRRAKDGRIFEVSCALSPIRDDGGNVIGVAVINRDISALKQAQRELKRTAELARLMEALARSAAEAPTPDAALRACVGHIAQHGRWDLAHCVTFIPGQEVGQPRSSFWHGAGQHRYAELIDYSDNDFQFRAEGNLGRPLPCERRAVWIEDLSRHSHTGRMPVAARLGLKTAFCFPVVIADHVTAVLEFFAADSRAPDAPLLDNIGQVGSQLAGVIERSRAAEETARLASIVESSSDAIFSRTLEGVITSWNAGAEKLYGYTATEAVGRNIRELLTPPDRMHEPERNLALLRQGIAVPPFETERVRKDGRHVEIWISASPIVDAVGKVVAVSVIARDITERKRAESERARLAAIVESSNDAIVGRSLDGTVTSWNVAAERMFGWPAHEAMGQPITIIVPPERRGEMRPLIERVMAGESVGAFESVHRRKDGSRINTSVTPSAVRNAAGIVESVSFFYRDITDYKRLQHEAQRKADLASLLENLARAANEAATPEAALEVCLQRICEHGQWQLGHAVVFQEGLGLGKAALSISRIEDRGRYKACIQFLEKRDYSKSSGTFAGKAATTQAPVWLADMATERIGSRMSRLAANGMRRAFVFPVLAHGQVLALLEFFGREPRPADELLITNIQSVGGQLARLIERQRAFVRLQASEARVRAIFDSEPECVTVIRPDGTLIDMNRSGLAALEAESLENVREHGLLNFVLPGHRGGFADFVRGNLSGEPCTLEFEIEAMKGTRRWMKSHATRIRLPDERDEALLVITRDITTDKQAREKANYLADHDALTGLPNRGLFQDRLERAIAQAHRRGEVLGILMLNLDRFGRINENLGAGAGDQLLAAVAQRMQATLRNVDTIARLGGNEFAVLVEGVANAAEVAVVAERINEAFSASFQLDGNEVFLSASVGVAMFPNGTSDPAALLQHAESAMRDIKREGGNGHQMYDDGRKHENVPHVNLEGRLRHAVDNGELELHYQPKVNLSTGEIVGAEALVRWKHPELGMVGPAQFIPLAEETGLILPIGEWVLNSACKFASSWQDVGVAMAVAVNLSPRQFRHKNLLGVVINALESSGLAPERLELEITETAALSHPERAESVLKMLRGLGVRIALDDFGTGHSSLSHLRRLPLDAVKIDRSFVCNVAIGIQDRAIVSGVTALAHALNMRVTAEGIENDAQLEAIGQCGCDEYQGYYFSRPLPAAEFRVLAARVQQQHPGASIQSVPKASRGGPDLRRKQVVNNGQQT